MENTLIVFCRDLLNQQLMTAQSKCDSELLSRGVAEEQLSYIEKEKTMMELELKETINRHRVELNRKDATINNVSMCSVIAVFF